MNDRTRMIANTVAILSALLIGLLSLFLAAPLSILGLLLILPIYKPTVDQNYTAFQRHAIRISLVINGLVFLSLFLFPLGIFAQGIIELAGVATVMGFPVLMTIYGWRMAKEHSRSTPLYAFICFAITGVITFLILRAGVLLVPAFSETQSYVFAFGMVAAMTSFFAVRLLFRLPTTMSRRIGIQQILILILALCVIHLEAYNVAAWNFRKKLPWSATDVHEWHWEDFLIPDYSYCLKAKMSEEAFLDYVQEFGLEKKEMPLENKYVSWSGPREDQSWWDVSTNLDDTYMFIDAQGDGWTLAKYENGYLYLHSSEF
jgi:hypothetical protein